MPEPVSTTIGPFVVSGSTIYLTGSFLGLEYGPMVAGFFGGFIVLAFIRVEGRLHALRVVLVSALLAGGATSIAARIAVARLPELAAVDVPEVRNFCALLIGIGAHSFVPLFLRLLRKFGGAHPTNKGDVQ